jgi:hypothetical protein
MNNPCLDTKAQINILYEIMCGFGIPIPYEYTPLILSEKHEEALNSLFQSIQTFIDNKK